MGHNLGLGPLAKGGSFFFFFYHIDLSFFDTFYHMIYGQIKIKACYNREETLSTLFYRLVTIIMEVPHHDRLEVNALMRIFTSNGREKKDKRESRDERIAACLGAFLTYNSRKFQELARKLSVSLSNESLLQY